MLPNCKWTDESREAFILAMQDETCSGSAVDSGFKSAGWTKIVAAVEQKGFPYTKQQFQSQYKNLKAGWVMWVAIMGNSGFGINHETMCATADNNVWEEFLIAHPGGKIFRTKAMFMFEELNEVFDGKAATGKYAVSSFQPTVRPSVQPTVQPSQPYYQSSQMTFITPSPSLSTFGNFFFHWIFRFPLDSDQPLHSRRQGGVR
jgi:hypothetical protein